MRRPVLEPCQATGVDHSNEAQSSKVCWSLSADDTPLPNPTAIVKIFGLSEDILGLTLTKDIRMVHIRVKE